MSLEGRRIALLGGSSGIGLAAARLALQAFFRDARAIDHDFVTTGAPHYAPLATIDPETAGRAVADRMKMML